MWFERIESPIGDILLAGEGDALTTLDFADCEERMEELLRLRFGAVDRSAAVGTKAADRLNSYFRGELEALDEVEIAPNGTEFQQQTWTALRMVGPGETISYGGLAQRIGRPKASRAVGMANARNPIGLVVPCHRVIGTNGKLTGYAGGLERKRWLLQHEGAQLSLL